MNETLALMKMSELEDRRPIQLSGGRQQCVALVRTLTTRPRVLRLEAAVDLVRCRLEGDAELFVTPAPGACAQGPVTLSLRPERIVISASAADGLAGRVKDCVYRGVDLVYRVEFGKGPELTVRERNVPGRTESLGPGHSVLPGIAPGAAARMISD